MQLNECSYQILVDSTILFRAECPILISCVFAGVSCYDSLASLYPDLVASSCVCLEPFHTF